jgi:hypothetical protein
MSRLNRGKAKKGLAEERWKLINRYMAHSENLQRAAEEAALPPEDEDAAPSLPDTTEAARVEAEVQAVEESDAPDPAAAPPRPDAEENAKSALGSPTRPERAPLATQPVRQQDVGKALQTLAEVNRLCGDVSRLSAEVDRLRGLIAQASTRLVPPS